MTDLTARAVPASTLAEDGRYHFNPLGIHAPLFNLWNDEYPYFLRETQRRDQEGQERSHGS